MACILKAPTEGTKGVVTFTTQERDRLIQKDKELQEKIWPLKDRWVVGLHHNWHDYNFVYNPLFDFSMAGEEDLREVSGKHIPLIPMDACNFVPEFFKPSQGEKFWDILYIARAVFFKRIPEFFECIRTLYDRGYRYRVLFICPIPPYDRKGTKTVFYNIRDVYDEMFSDEEKNLFVLLTLNYRYPFPFDLETLAYFYRSSKIFVHFADDEKRCRVAAYAWATGIPVVGMSCVGSLLPKDLRVKPYYYEVSDYSHFPEQMVRALNDSKSNKKDFEKVRENFNVVYTKQVLSERLEKLFTANSLDYETSHLSLSNLDVRLGRHYDIGSGPNTISTPLSQFLDVLQNQEEIIKITIMKHQDPERELEILFPVKSKPSFFRRMIGR